MTAAACNKANQTLILGAGRPVSRPVARSAQRAFNVGITVGIQASGFVSFAVILFFVSSVGIGEASWKLRTPS